MTLIGIIVFIILAWYPCYKHLVFPRLLGCEWFRKSFEVTAEKEEAFNMGLGVPGLSSGFWLFYFLGFALLTTPIVFFMVYRMFR